MLNYLPMSEEEKTTSLHWYMYIFSYPCITYMEGIFKYYFIVAQNHILIKEIEID